MSEIPITVRGDVDDRAVEQLRRCAAAGDAVAGVLCADGHVGYSQPIGGAVAYPDHISPSGVGYDIACIAAGEDVLLAGGRVVSIEDALAGAACVDTSGGMRPVRRHLGVVAKGAREVMRLTLGNGRKLRATADHRIRTARGWVELVDLTAGDEVLCPVFRGHRERRDDVVARLVGMINGDGHVTRERVAIFSASTEVAAEVAVDLRRITGRDPSLHVRRRPNGSFEQAVYVDSIELVERLVAAGAIAGRKAGRWATLRVAGDPWSYLSGLASAEGTTPALIHARPASLTIKQKGRDAAEHVEQALDACGFASSVTRSGDGDVYALQVTGGLDETIRFYEEVGFCHEPAKRRAAAHVASWAWAARPVLGVTRQVVHERVPIAAAGVVDARPVAARPARRTRAHLDRSLGESCWVPVAGVAPAGVAPTYDVVTDDPEHAFIAGGMAVHNCGNKAVRSDVLVDDVRGDLPRIMDDVYKRISFGVGRRNSEPVDHPVLDEIGRAEFRPQRKLAQMARNQLGTVGAGNHYVDLFAGDDGFVWVGVHFGSRGFGHKTASGFLSLAAGGRFDERGREGEMDSPPVLLHVDSELGRDYVAAMQLAGRYAYAGRDVVVDKVLEIFGAQATYAVHNHHNFAWRERHFGTDVWVIRKGCTPAFPGQEGFVGATMGEPSVILRGTEDPGGAALLRSTVHGAGRVMSRTQAAGRSRRRWVCNTRDCDWVQPAKSHPPKACPRCGSRKLSKRMVQVSEGRIDFPAVQQRLAREGIELRGGAADEAPGAYKRLDVVLAAHGPTVEVVHRLHPIGVAMAGADTFDPYKD